MKQLGLCLLLGYWSCISAAGELSAAAIERWLSSQPAVEAWGDEHKDAFSHRSDNSMLEVKDFIEPLQQAGLYGEMKSLLGRHGYDTPEQWAQATVQIVSAYAATQLRASPMESDPDFLRQQLQQLDNHPHMSAEQKQEMKNMMLATINMIERFRQVPDADVAAIQPYLSQLDQLMGDGSES
ncbi:hypothetical protein CHH28_07630 [Bacterioplanes sanyensis]|uniref:Uncharacterized protein n=1 Tax=Bacterioplanes sanyensis TaxID=1249553 RepID=A0A222FIS2_9GAMM|nr:hypothetical protein [Bacterioplanes sanyensis]ASP38552.1 hypothetical protein CHH28_07630 [Bacterioplanes sanyensis]